MIATGAASPMIIRPTSDSLRPRHIRSPPEEGPRSDSRAVDPL